MNVASVKLLFSLQSLVAQSISKTKNSEQIKTQKKKKKNRNEINKQLGRYISTFCYLFILFFTCEI